MSAMGPREDSWSNVSPGKLSLSAWLAAQGFGEAVTGAVRAAKLKPQEVKVLKEWRASARGEDGALSNAQLRVLQPSAVGVSNGMLSGFRRPQAGSSGAPTAGGVRTVKFNERDCQGGSASEIKDLRKQVKDLEILVRKQASNAAAPGSGTVSAAVPSPCIGRRRGEGEMEVARTAETEPLARPRTCHVCGSSEHLKAECPAAIQIRKLEAWLAVLEGGECLLEPFIKTQQIQVTSSRLAALKREVMASKAQTVPPERVLATKRADARKAAAAMADARKDFEAKQLALADLQAEVDKCNAAMHRTADLFRQAEIALEVAQRDVAAAILPPPPITLAAPLARGPGRSRSPAGFEALEALRRSIVGLGSQGVIAEAQREHTEQTERHLAQGSEPPPPFAEFVLKRLQAEGTKQLDTISFELSADPQASVFATGPADAVGDGAALPGNTGPQNQFGAASTPQAQRGGPYGPTERWGEMEGHD